MDVVNGLLVFFFLILMIIYCWKAAMTSIATREVTPEFMGVSGCHYKLMIPIGAMLLLLQGLANWLRSLYRLITDKAWIYEYRPLNDSFVY